MKASLDTLLKIIKLEASRGYDNRAVYGGLERYLETWAGDARADGISEELIQFIGQRLRDYPRLREASRAENLEGLWKRLERDANAPPVPDLPPPAGMQDAEDERAAEPAPKRQAPPATEATGTPAPQAQTWKQEPAPPATRRSRSARRAPSGEPFTELDAPVTVLPNVGEKYAQTLARLELFTLRDMLYFLPRKYLDYAQLVPINRLEYGSDVTVIGTLEKIGLRDLKGGAIKLVEGVLSDGSGHLRLTWFNQPWNAKRLRTGVQYAVSGTVEQYLGRPVISNPEIEQVDQQQLHTNRIVPVYSLTSNITQRWLRRVLHSVVSHYAERVPDYLPEWLLDQADLLDLASALEQVHFPESWDDLRVARQRLAFNEIFLLQLGVQRQKIAWQNRPARLFPVSDEWLAEWLSGLPFPLTGAQQRAVQEIRQDLSSGHPLNRLLQGDVGSGKTVVAGLAIAMVVQSGAQAAIMAPTSILAEQHYQNLVRMLAGDGKALPESAVRLMVGATPNAEKDELRAGLESGEIKVLIGTHALIEDPVTFADLQLAIVDEQHRFGVAQRSALRTKGDNPHLLVMTATPIPRSLALSVYGDLDLTVMDEMPPGRQPVGTYVLTPRERERAYRLINSQIEAGRQAFIIYPLVEESEKSQSKAAVAEYTRLQEEVYPRLKLGLLHGRLTPDEKETVMAAFKSGEVQILVSTSVVEVGVDIPNATVMLIEGANRFGLAQLHQFRGRVGRGAEQSYCILIPDREDEVENERLQVMAETTDGFVLAERDLEQRGPGEFLGTRQSGFSELQVAKLTDVHLIEKARHHAQKFFERDPDLSQPGHQALAEALESFWNPGQGDVS